MSCGQLDHWSPCDLMLSSRDDPSVELNSGGRSKGIELRRVPKRACLRKSGISTRILAVER